MCDKIKIYKVYKIYNSINNKLYIGWTGKKRIHDRLCAHKYSAKTCNNNNSKLFNAMNKYGADNFYIQEVWNGNCLFLSQLIEKFMIKEYNSIEDGYNIREGGGNAPCSEETKEKIRKAHIRLGHTEETKQKLREYRLNQPDPRKGCEPSEETLRRMSLSKKGIKQPNHRGMTGKKLSETHKKALFLSVFGRKHTEESKLKMSLAKMGNKPSLETIEKLRASHLGKPLSKSTKAKLSAALMGKNKGHIHTEETKPDIHPIDKSRGF